MCCVGFFCGVCVGRGFRLHQHVDKSRVPTFILINAFTKSQLTAGKVYSAPLKWMGAHIVDGGLNRTTHGLVHLFGVCLRSPITQSLWFSMSLQTWPLHLCLNVFSKATRYLITPTSFKGVQGCRSCINETSICLFCCCQSFVMYIHR